MQAMKYEQHAKNLLRVASEEAKLAPSKLVEYRKLMAKHFGSVYDALNEARMAGSSVLTEIGLPADFATALTRLAESRLEAPHVTLVGIATTEVHDPHGIKFLKQAYQQVLDQVPTLYRGLKVKVTSISAPTYRIEIEASEWKEAENAWKKAQEIIRSTLHSKASVVKFERS